MAMEQVPGDSPAVLSPASDTSSTNGNVAIFAKEASLPNLPSPLLRTESSSSVLNGKERSMSDVKAHSAGYEKDCDMLEAQSHRRTLSSDKLTAKFKPPFKKNQDAPISKELSERARSAPLVKKFALPPSETLINDYSAALLKHILIHGRMFVSQNYICFESKIFGIKTMEVIPFKDITSLTRKSKKLKFAHGLEVATSSQTYYFASFVSRERAYETLTKIWREHVPKDPQNPDDDDDDDDDDDTQDYESDDSSLKKKDKRLSKDQDGMKLGRSVECPPEPNDEKERGLRRFSSPILSRVLPKHGSSTSSGASSSSTSLTTDSGGSKNEKEQPMPSNTQSAPASLPATTFTSTSSSTSVETPVPSPTESEEEEDTNYDSGDGFLGSEAPMQQVLVTTFPVNVKTFFKIFFSDESTFSKTYHETRGDRDLLVKKWSNNPQFGLIRDVHFQSPVKVPLGPSHTRINETQRYHLSKNRLLIDTITMMLDIPYGDSFRVEGKWDITLQTPDSCKLVVNIGVHFMKKTWFKGKIETQTLKETKESFHQWAGLAPSEITKYKSSNPTPSQPNSTAPSPMTTRANVASPPSSLSSSTSSAASSSSLSSSSLSSSISPPLGDSLSFTPAVPLEGPRRASVDGKSKFFFSPPNPFQGQSIANLLWFLVFGFVFMHMYMRIAHLEGQVATLQTILQPLLSKELQNINNIAKEIQNDVVNVEL